MDHDRDSLPGVDFGASVTRLMRQNLGVPERPVFVGVGVEDHQRQLGILQSVAGEDAEGAFSSVAGAEPLAADLGPHRFYCVTPEQC
jgi:hypothetical protein